MQLDKFLRLRPSMGMLTQHLQEQGIRTVISLENAAVTLDTIRVYREGMICNSGVLYLLGEQAPDETDCCCIGILEQPRLHNYIRCPDQTPEELLNLVLELFAQCRQWEYRLDQAVYNNLTLSQLCNVGAELLENPVCIHDDWFLINAMSQGFSQVMEPEYPMTSSKGFIPSAIVEDFREDGEYLETFAHRTAQVWEPGRGIAPSLYVNLWNGTVYMGRLLVAQKGRPFRAADLPLAELLAQCAMRLMLLQKREAGTAAQSMDDIIYDLLQGKSLDTGAAMQLLNTLHWSRTDRFLCIQVQGQQAMTSIMAHELHSELFRCFPESYILLSGSRQTVAVNLTRSGMTASQLRPLLAPVCRDYYLYAGVSAEVSGIRELEFAHRQAVIAIEYAFASHSQQWIVPFEQCAMEHLLDAIGSPLPLRHLAAPQLRQLQHHDREKGTQLFETFRTYLLLERDIPKTAATLIIHRTTLLYRLKKYRPSSAPTWTTPRQDCISSSPSNFCSGIRGKCLSSYAIFPL